MSGWNAQRVMSLKTAYPHQIRIKHFRRKCRDGELDHGCIMLAAKDGANWYQSRKSGHKIFGFRTRAELEVFIVTCHLTEEGD